MTQTSETAETIFKSYDKTAWIVTAKYVNQASGLLATFVQQASLVPDRPLVLAGIASTHFTAELIDASNAFALHLLGKDQAAFALRFALASGRDTDKLAGVKVDQYDTKTPIISNCLSWLDCRVMERFVLAERILFCAEVVAARRIREEEPLTQRDLIAAATPEQRATLNANRDADIACQRPLLQRWLVERSGG